MLTDFIQSGLFRKCSSIWHYKADIDPQHQQTRFICNDAEDIERIHQYIRDRYIHNHYIHDSHAPSVLSTNLSANGHGSMVASIPDAWVMFGYCPVPQHLKSWRVHTWIQSRLASMFPYPAEQLSFDYIPVPSSMQAVIQSIQKENGEQPEKNTRLYQVMACDSAKINALTSFAEQFHCKLLSVLPHSYTMIHGDHALHLSLSSNPEWVQMLIKRIKTRQYAEVLAHSHRQQWQDIKLVLGMQEACQQ